MPTCPTCGTSFGGSRCPLCGAAAPASPTPASAAPASPAPARRAPASPAPASPAPVSPARTGAAPVAPAPPARPGIISGTLVRVEGPRMMPMPPDYWRMGCAILAFTAFLPIALALWAISLSFRVTAHLLGMRSLASMGGAGLGGFFLVRLLAGRRDREDRTIPSYQLVVNTPHGTRVARQEGEFVSAQPLVGHEVTLRGGMRDGVLVVRGGRDETLGIELRRRPNPYAIQFFVLLAALGGAVVALGAGR